MTVGSVKSAPAYVITEADRDGQADGHSHNQQDQRQPFARSPIATPLALPRLAEVVGAAAQLGVAASD